MAKYDISPEGLDSLRILYRNLSGAMEETEQSSAALAGRLEALEGLGVYHKEILILAGEVIRAVRRAREGNDGIDALLGSLKKLADDMEGLLYMDLLLELEDAEGDNEEPQQIQRTLRMR